MNGPLNRRRWFRFSVRTLLVAVTIFCGWLGWHWRAVQNRRNAILAVETWEGPHPPIELGGFFRPEFRPFDEDYETWAEEEPQSVSWVRRMMGDEAIWRIQLYKLPNAEIRELLDANFREAEIFVFRKGESGMSASGRRYRDRLAEN